MANQQYTTYREYIDLQDMSGSSLAEPSMKGAMYYGTSSFRMNDALDVDGTFDCTGKITTDAGIEGASLVLAAGATVTAIADEDNMASNSATKLATQQSIKAYVDAQVTAQDLDFQGDSGGALSIDLDSETLDIAGGTGIDTAGSLNTLTVAIDSTVATLTGTQTFTNKTLTSPDVNAPDIDGGTIDGATIATSDVTVGASKTLDVSAGTLTTSAAQNLAIMQAAAANVDIGAYEMRASTFESDVSTGTAPLVVASTTEVANLNAASLSGADWDAPLAIGGTTPAAGSFAALVGTTATFSGDLTANANSTFGNASSDVITCTGQLTASQGAKFSAAISGSGKAEFGGNLTIGPSQYGLTTAGAAKIASMSANWTNAGRTVADMGIVTTMDLNGGTIDGATIATSDVTVGASKTLDVSAGTFTTSVAQNLAKLTSGIANNDRDQDFGAFEVRAQTFESDVSTGTAPLVVASTTNVANLNASSLNGATMASPGAIGGTSAAAGTFAALVGTSLSVSDGNITNVGVLEADTIQSDADAAGLNINFDGNTGTNKLSLADNLASALDITQGANSYIKFDSTDGDEALSFGTTPIVEFLSTGGSTGDADFSVSGYAQFAGIVEVDGALDCDSTSTFAGLATLAAGATLSGGDLTVTSGDITCSSTSSEVKAGSFVTYSDAALKTNVETVDNAMDMIQGLRGVSYDLKANGTREYGFIAQEVNEILPEVVSTSGNLMGIDYTRITSLLVEAVKTQQAEIIALQEKLDK
jgi:hypothetical protein